jgi:hypothetical protein
MSLKECDNLMILYYLGILSEHGIVEVNTPALTDKGFELAKTISDYNYCIRPDSMVRILLVLFGDTMDKEDTMSLCMMIEILQTDGIDELLDNLESDED